jgi:hypothetical protein
MILLLGALPLDSSNQRIQVLAANISTWSSPALLQARCCPISSYMNREHAGFRLLC